MHSIIDIITNSSTEIFVVHSDLSEEEFVQTLKEIYSSVSHLPFPFVITKENNKYSFNAGYYWGFYGTIFDTLEGYSDEAEHDRFTQKLDEIFPGWESYEVG